MNRTQMVIGFGLYGPMWGGLALMGYMVLDHATGQQARMDASAVLMGLPLYMFFSYLYGLLPALITGAVLSMYRYARGPLIWWLAKGACTGAVVGFTTGCAAQAWMMGLKTLALPFLGLYVGGASAFSAMCCALLYRPLAEPQ